MEKSICFFPLLLLCITLAALVHGQLQTGFISIDCGMQENFKYTDTGITYVSDEAYVETGINRNISSDFAYPKNPNLPMPLSDLRSFPEENKNCYTLKTTGGRGSLNLVRATFLYGNYDGEDKLPEFDLYLDVNLWSTVKFRNASDVFTTEVIGVAQSDTVSVCFVDKGLGIPFISALELRPLNNSIYTVESGAPVLLVLQQRLDYGSSNGSGRYKDDIYDRLWLTSNSSSSLSVSTSLPVDNTGNGYKAPSQVIQTGITPQNASDSFELKWTGSDMNSRFHIYMYFAELEKLEKNQTRKFNVSWNGSPLFGPIVPRYLYAETMSNLKALVGKEHHISINKTEDSTLPPLFNAVEIFMAKKYDEFPTHSEDVNAMTNIKIMYRIKQNWVGDPCGPKNYSWEGLLCSYNGSNSPRIISLNLTSRGLSGTIAASIANLSAIQTLDFSNNTLTGSVPEFLEKLQSLKFLNLKGNQLVGYVPTTLIERSNGGMLTLIVDDQNLCLSGSCKRKKNNIVIPIVASISSALVLLVALFSLWKLWNKQSVLSKEGRFLASKNQQFTYADVVSITNNFQRVIGKGGFGSVYLGHMKDGTQVAVKMLSQSSSQGPKQFRTEAELLMRIHHRNLAPFVGFCEEGKAMALIYEYMANGNLKDHLSDRNSHTLSWEMRLQIAIDAAQGLEYLHHGCKPPIVHRDVKTANILLAENFDAKIADFGLSKVFPTDDSSDVSTTVMGTRGYLDPEYYIIQKLNEKSDVYSFGIVLLELITGQPAIIKSSDYTHIVQWVGPLLERGEILSIVDPRLQGNFKVNSVWKALEVAMACTRTTSIQRASMSHVLTELKECLELEVGHDKGAKHREEFYELSQTPTEVFTSTDSESITAPYAR